MDAVNHVYVHLLAGHKADGDRVLEAVPAAPAGEPSTFRLIATPGLVEGTAAEDIVRVEADGSFDVVRRGGNLAVHVFARGLADEAYSNLEADVERLGGYLDGGGGTHQTTVRVFTVPVAAGFAAVEAAFNAFAKQHPEAHWSFGNVYDPADGVTPLNWWQE
jgi:hypothetical protein